MNVLKNLSDSDRAEVEQRLALGHFSFFCGAEDELIFAFPSTADHIETHFSLSADGQWRYFKSPALPHTLGGHG